VGGAFDVMESRRLRAEQDVEFEKSLRVDEEKVS